MTFDSFGQRFAIGALFCTFLAGCISNPDEPDYGFGEADMHSAIIGDWSGNMSLTGQTPTTFTLSIKRVPAMQPACGSRTFNSPLCVETTFMNVEGTLTTADKVFDGAKLQGSFMVFGLEMSNGELFLSGTGVDINGGLEVEKTSHDLSVSGTHQGNLTMQR